MVCQGFLLGRAPRRCLRRAAQTPPAAQPGKYPSQSSAHVSTLSNGPQLQADNPSAITMQAKQLAVRLSRLTSNPAAGRTWGTAPRSVGRDSSPGRCTGAVLAAPRGFGCALVRICSQACKIAAILISAGNVMMQQTCFAGAAAASASAFRRLRGGIGRLSLLKMTTPARLEPFAGRPPYACVTKSLPQTANENKPHGK